MASMSAMAIAPNEGITDTTMYIGEQLINPTTERLQLSAQLGVGNVVIDTRPNPDIVGDDGCWDSERISTYRRRLADLGLALDCLALDAGSVLVDVLQYRERADRTLWKLRHDILAAG